MSSALDIVKSFDENSLPDLDLVTMAALELFEKTQLPVLNVNRFRHPLILGSGNALVAAKAIFSHTQVVFVDESNYESAIFTGQADGAYIFSASGSKHAVTFAKALSHKDIPTVLVTNNQKSPAQIAVPAMDVLIFPKNREPYTYNASTYMGMFLAATRENPSKIKAFIESEVLPNIPKNIGEYEAYYLLLPELFSPITNMFVTKFDELFGSRLLGRAFTFEQSKHAKTVIKNDKELFISFGKENTTFGKSRINIPLPNDANFATMMAVGYFVIGHIQKNKPPYFKDSIGDYMKEASQLFDNELTVIVE
jgi:hypothetical protein